MEYHTTTAATPTADPSAGGVAACETQHIMLDLETMGRGPDAAIVAIGAVAFGLQPDGYGLIGPTFYRIINLASAVQHGGVMDASTVLWWLGQSDAARDELIDSQAQEIVPALSDFASWLDGLRARRVRVWGNGAGFDNVIIRRAYERAGWQQAPWAYWDDRCYRTVRAEYGIDVPPPPRRGVRHNALDDATCQAQHLCAIWRHQALRGREALPKGLRHSE